MSAVLDAVITPQAFRTTMGRFATGVTVVGYHAEGRPAGMTANAFMSVSLAPPLVLVSVRQASRFAACVGLGSAVGISLLAEDQQAISGHFGGRPVADLAPPFEPDAAVPLVAGALAQIVAEVVDIHPAGDHLLCVAQVQQLMQGRAAAPLVFHGGQYRQLQPARPAVTWHSQDGW